MSLPDLSSSFLRLLPASFRGLFEKNALLDLPFSRPTRAALFQVGGADGIDAQSWDDLLMDPYLDTLAPGTSLFGQQMLYRRLRAGLSVADGAALNGRLARLRGEPHLRAELEQLCQPLRRAEVDISADLFGAAEPAAAPSTAWLLPWLALAVPLSVVLGMFSFIGWICLAASLFGLIAVQSHYFQAMHIWDQKMHGLQQMLRVSSLLSSRAAGDGEALLAGFLDQPGRSGKINRALTRSSVIDAIPFLRIYLDWFAAANVRHYFKQLNQFALHRDYLCARFLLCADIEADLALARHLASNAGTCLAERHGGTRALAFTRVRHPLLADAAPLSLALDGKGAFISGQNGVGKSTLLRTTGLNLITARGFGFCYADVASVPECTVIASMKSEDSLLGGESLYISELRRGREMLAAANSGLPHIYLVDEIFRGTNHLESVSAAAAVLDALCKHGLVLVSSHNLVLGPLLEHALLPLHLRLDNGLLALHPGVLAHTNGLQLLAQRGFDADIAASAARVFDWLDHHLAHPGDCTGVLAPASSLRVA